MDVVTLRITLAVVAGVLLALFYLGAYRPTRAPFSGLWSLSLLLFLLGSLAYLADGTPAQAVLNPLGNAFGIAGAEAAWCAARSLRERPIRWPCLLIAPAVAIVAGALDHPATNTWAGGLVFLLIMAGAFGLACRDLLLAERHDGERSHVVLTRSLAAASALLAVFYAGRAIAFAVDGADGRVFLHWFGTGPTTLLLIAQLVTVSFSMSSLSTQQRLDDLHRRAVYDGLTGLLRPQEFRAKAPEALRALLDRGRPAMLAMADLDHFKQINDDLGHATGDLVLGAFGRTARSMLGTDALCGRLGGEEFALLFGARDADDAERALTAMIEEFQRAVPLPDGRIPTVSMGLVQVTEDASVSDLLARADRALYRAKDRGRSQVVRD